MTKQELLQSYQDLLQEAAQDVAVTPDAFLYHTISKATADLQDRNPMLQAGLHLLVWEVDYLYNQYLDDTNSLQDKPIQEIVSEILDTKDKFFPKHINEDTMLSIAYPIETILQYSLDLNTTSTSKLVKHCVKQEVSKQLERYNTNPIDSIIQCLLDHGLDPAPKYDRTLADCINQRIHILENKNQLDAVLEEDELIM